MKELILEKLSTKIRKILYKIRNWYLIKKLIKYIKERLESQSRSQKIQVTLYYYRRKEESEEYFIKTYDGTGYIWFYIRFLTTNKRRTEGWYRRKINQLLSSESSLVSSVKNKDSAIGELILYPPSLSHNRYGIVNNTGRISVFRGEQKDMWTEKILLRDKLNVIIENALQKYKEEGGDEDRGAINSKDFNFKKLYFKQKILEPLKIRF